MKINYIGTFRAEIGFDDIFTYFGMNDEYHPIQDYIDKAIYFMGEYCFTTAQIVDCETGEIIVEMEEKNNDNQLPYSDDNNTLCNYQK